MPGDELRLRLNSSAYANLANADVCVLSSGMSVISCYITYVYLCILMLSQVICPVKKTKETGWNAVGHVSKITANEEVALELRGPQQVRFIQPVMPTRPTQHAQPVGWPMGYQPRLPSGVCHCLKEKKRFCKKKTFKCHLNADIDEVWKSTSFDRMQAAMRTFAVDDTSARSLEGRNATGKNLEFQDTSQSFLKSVTVKQWSFRFSKF